MFKFEASCTRHKEQGEIVQKVWRAKHQGPNPWACFHGKLIDCRRSLKKWVRKQRSPVEIQIQQKMEDLHLVQSGEMSALPEPEASVKAELNALLEEEDLKWRQRAKENWLKFGDRNSKYFHACANQ